MRPHPPRVRAGSAPDQARRGEGHRNGHLVYLELVQSRRELMLQLQAFAAASVPTLRPAIRESFIDVMSDIRRLLGGDTDEAALFTARGGMLLNILTALEVLDDFWPTPLTEAAARTVSAPAERSGSGAVTG